MVQRVYERSRTAKHLSRLIIATDDGRIHQACKSFGAEVWMTSPDHHSGTERVAEVAERVNTPIIINIQGDEPLIKGEMIDELVLALQHETILMATLAAKVKDLDEFEKKDMVKVVVDKEGFALYFSRSPIPFEAQDYFLKHIGLYGYQRDFLLRLRNMPASRLERAEKLEQLRALENGFRIKVIESAFSTLSVDSPQDIIRVDHHLRKREDE